MKSKGAQKSDRKADDEVHWEMSSWCDHPPHHQKKYSTPTTFLNASSHNNVFYSVALITLETVDELNYTHDVVMHYFRHCCQMKKKKSFLAYYKPVKSKVKTDMFFRKWLNVWKNYLVCCVANKIECWRPHLSFHQLGCSLRNMTLDGSAHRSPNQKFLSNVGWLVVSL